MNPQSWLKEHTVYLVTAGSHSYGTPDGIWHQQGRMGWFGMSEDEVSDSDWEQEVKSYLAANPDTITVVCDLHI